MNSNIVSNVLIYAIGYFLLIIMWYKILPVLGIQSTLLETILVSLGYALACTYLVITERQIDVLRFVYGVLFYVVARLFTPIFAHNELVYAFIGEESVKILEMVFYLMFIIAVIVYSSDILREQQALETQEITNIRW